MEEFQPQSQILDSFTQIRAQMAKQLYLYLKSLHLVELILVMIAQQFPRFKANLSWSAFEQDLR